MGDRLHTCFLVANYQNSRTLEDALTYNKNQFLCFTVVTLHSNNSLFVYSNLWLKYHDCSIFTGLLNKTTMQMYSYPSPISVFIYHES